MLILDLLVTNKLSAIIKFAKNRCISAVLEHQTPNVNIETPQQLPVFFLYRRICFGGIASGPFHSYCSEVAMSELLSYILDHEDAFRRYSPPFPRVESISYQANSWFPYLRKGLVYRRYTPTSLVRNRQIPMDIIAM